MHSHSEFMYDLFIAVIYRSGTIFLPLRVWVYVHSLLYSSGKAIWRNLLRYGPSRSFNVIDVGTDRKPTYDFLLVFHCNYCFRDDFFSDRESTCVFSAF